MPENSEGGIQNPGSPAPKRSHKKKAQTQGVGASRPFVATPGTFEESYNWAKLTVNGQPIPEDLWGTFPYRMTDQGAIEFNAGKEPARAEVLRSEPLSSRPADELVRTMRDRSIEQSVDQFRESMELAELENPQEVLMKQHLPAGMRGLWMSERKVAKEGMRRGVLDYVPVLIEVDGKKERVRSGEMFLGMVPEAKARAADAHYARKAESQMVAAVETVQEQTEAFMTEGRQKRVVRQGRGEYDGFQHEDSGQVMADLVSDLSG
jgi:hypothetical protein